MYLVDTDVISEARKGTKAHPGVQGFFDQATRDQTPLYLSAVTIGELRQGVDSIRERSAGEYRPVAVAGHPASDHASPPGARTPQGRHRFPPAYTPHEGRDLLAGGAVRLAGR